MLVDVDGWPLDDDIGTLGYVLQASDKSCKDEGTGEGKEFKFATGVKPIPDICVVILNVLNEEGILIGDVKTEKALVLESSYVAKDAEEANRRGN